MAKILFVDDEPELLGFMERHFTEQGHEILTTLCGREAIAMILDAKPDLALIDVRLKDDINGLQVIKEVHEKNPGQKMVLVTAYNDKDEAALKYGALSCVRKPCGFKELEDAITAALERPL